jgi:hypothetical protein
MRPRGRRDADGQHDTAALDREGTDVRAPWKLRKFTFFEVSKGVGGAGALRICNVLD